MCKLFAYVSLHKTTVPPYIGTKINKVLRHLFYINSYGQVDGSGIMWTTSEGKSYFYKEEEDSTELLESKVFETLRPNMYKQKFLAGHTRYSTVGANSVENSHPFRHGRYLGMQNGTIKNDHKTLVGDDVSPCEVDSESVIWAMNKQGIEATFDNYEGEGVFMFMDLDDATFNIVKNSKRALHRAKITGYDIYIFATDAHAIEYTASRAALTIDKVEEVEDDTLITYDLEGGITTSELVVKTPVPITYPAYDSGLYYGNRRVSYGNTDQSYYYEDWDDYYYGTSTPADNTKTIPFQPVVKDVTKPSEYLSDCAMCSNPLFTYGLVFADNTNASKAELFACSCCAVSVTANSNIPMYPITKQEKLCLTQQ